MHAGDVDEVSPAAGHAVRKQGQEPHVVRRQVRRVHHAEGEGQPRAGGAPEARGVEHLRPRPFDHQAEAHRPQASWRREAQARARAAAPVPQLQRRVALRADDALGVRPTAGARASAQRPGLEACARELRAPRRYQEDSGKLDRVKTCAGRLRRKGHGQNLEDRGLHGTRQHRGREALHRERRHLLVVERQEGARGLAPAREQTPSSLPSAWVKQRVLDHQAHGVELVLHKHSAVWILRRNEQHGGI
mmetsp:Transcript_84699/g.272947  ORF Transcript_84699/g.272947 Transcript_84699/m.272947 type:complete len:247 (-) Transcript_84699:1173-1913(-)